jgi:hypothetical protein
MYCQPLVGLAAKQEKNSRVLNMMDSLGPNPADLWPAPLGRADKRNIRVREGWMISLVPERFFPVLSALGLLWVSGGCSSEDACTDNGGADGLSTCLEPAHSDAYYEAQSHLYFNTMDANEDRDVGPNYAELVARWEWPPWLKLTAFGREDIIESDLLLRLYESTVPERDCRAFGRQPFGRCRVTFYYTEHEGRGCPIYEEFTFNDAGEVTFIEAWSDLPGMLPMDDSDEWAEGDTVDRLSTRIPGLGSAEGRVDLSSSALAEAAAEDDDVADFVARATDWRAAWVEELEGAGDDLWERGCGW